jgi:hypothetical protein
MGHIDRRLPPARQAVPHFDPLDKLAAIVALMIIWRLLGGC